MYLQSASALHILLILLYFFFLNFSTLYLNLDSLIILIETVKIIKCLGKSGLTDLFEEKGPIFRCRTEWYLKPLITICLFL